MLTSFLCPVCQGENWKIIKNHHFQKSDEIPNSLEDEKEYIKLRYRVLFEVWFPSLDKVILKSIMCRCCGFMTYTPRPSQTDVDAKYRFLQCTERNIGGQDSSQRTLDADSKRAERIYITLTCHTDKEHMTVLDFGGGNGKLLWPFLKRGHSCDLVDYTLEPLRGIRKIGDTLNDIPSNQKYDVIICSHVLEHLANPAQTVCELSSHLSDRGVIYTEVPMEIWEDISIAYDPVTHINFFTKNSFEAIFLQQGLQIIESKKCIGTYGGGRPEVLIIVARTTESIPSNTFKVGAAETMKLLNPSITMQLCRLWRYKRIPTIRGILKRLLLKLRFLNVNA